jgi:hypothetical protein
MTTIIKPDQPSRHLIMRRLLNTSSITSLRPSNTETISVRHSGNLSIPILTPGDLPCNRVHILAMIPPMKLREHSKISNSRLNSSQSLMAPRAWRIKLSHIPIMPPSSETLSNY